MTMPAGVPPANTGAARQAPSAKPTKPQRGAFSINLLAAIPVDDLLVSDDHVVNLLSASRARTTVPAAVDRLAAMDE
jgi:hypothetical protein